MTRSSGRAMSARRAGICTTMSPRGCRSRCWAMPTRRSWSTRCSPLHASGRSSSTSTRASRAPPDAIAAARDTATNPAVLDAFALVIISASGAPAFAGIAGHEPDLAKAKREAAAVSASLAEVTKLAPDNGAYVSESSYFQKDWQSAYWGGNYGRLRVVKQKYDPEGLFFVHNGVGSDDWSPDGFTRRP